MIARLVSLVVGYILGNFLSAEVVTRIITKKSIFDLGSGNPGMANTMRSVGIVPGIFVLAGDALKTIISLLISYSLFHDSMALHYAALGTLLGHNFPLWHHFDGGKGVVVTCLWLMILYRLWGVLCCIAGGLIVLFTSWLPLGAVVITSFGVIVAFLKGGKELGFLFTIACILMFIKHSPGLKKIINHQSAPHFFLSK